MTSDNLPQNHQALFLIPLETGSVTVAREFATAKYSLSKNELKAWYLFIASMDSHCCPQLRTTYVFDAVRFADKLNIDTRKARGTIVANIFTRLSKNYIDLRSREDNNGEQNIYHANFISELSYNKHSHILEVSIPPRLNDYLFNLKEGTYLTMDIEDILALDTVVSMRVFIYLRNLERIGIHEISVTQFRNEINLYPESSYKEFKRKVIKASMEEIRRHTDYKDFFIEDDGSPGRKATVISFKFTKDNTFDEYLLTQVSPAIAYSIRELQKKFSERVITMFTMALEKGFDPRYIKDNFDDMTDDRIVSNFHIVFERISKDKKSNKEKDAAVYGRYFITAVREDWAAQSNREKEAVKHADARIKNHELQKQMQDAQERDDIQSLTLFYQTKAKEYVSNMNLSNLMGFVRKNRAQLNSLAGQKGFNEEHAYTRKKTYKEYKLLTQVVIGKMMAGEIIVPKENILFPCHGRA